MFVFIRYKNIKYSIPKYNQKHEEGELFEIDQSYDPFVVRAFEMFNTRDAINDRHEYALFYKRLQSKSVEFIQQLKQLSIYLEHNFLHDICDHILIEISFRDFKI